MALTPNDIFARVADTLQDSGNVRWTATELLRYLNDGRRELALHRPDLYSQYSSITLASGTKQSIPSTGNKFLDATRNYTSGDVVGRSVSLVEREVLDSQNPDWHSSTSSTAIVNFTFDERSPKTFYVYPPASGNGHKLEILYSVTPVDVTNSDLTSTTILSKEDLHVNTLINYILSKAYSKDAEYTGNAQRAISHYNLFATAIGISKQQLYLTSPNVSNVQGVTPKETGAS